MSPILWEAPEYEERERTPDWFWALGIIIGAISLASIIYGNYFFAALIILGGGLLGYFARRKPDVVPYELSEQGLRAGSRIFPFENITAFWVETRGRDMLFVKTERLYLPIISMPVPEGTGEEIRAIFLAKNIPEEEMQEHLSEKVMDVLGF